MQKTFQRIADNQSFQSLILAVIVFVAILMGLETSPYLMERYGKLFHVLNTFIQVIFVLEVVIRIGAFSPKYQRFFSDGWNVFDFVIVAASLLPQAGPMATVARLARLLRVARLLSVSDELRLIISTMLKSIPSLGHVSMLLALLLYIYGIIGFHLLHKIDPENWGTLGLSILTLFEILTLEGWVELQNNVIGQMPWAWVFFGSYIIVAVFVVINLFIAVVLNNLESAKAEHVAEKKRNDLASLTDEGRSIRTRIDVLKQELEALERDLT